MKAWFDKRFIPFALFFLVIVLGNYFRSDFNLHTQSWIQIIYPLLIILLGTIGMFFAFEWIMLFLLRKKVNNLLQKGERVIYAKKVFFYLKTPSGKLFHNPIHPLEGISTKEGLVSSTALFLTSKDRILLIGNRTKNNSISPYTETLLDLTKSQIKKVTVEDGDINTGGLLKRYHCQNYNKRQ